MNFSPIVFIPGLLCTRDLFREQIAALEDQAKVHVAETRLDADMDAMADRLLREAPERFALCGLLSWRR